MRIRIRNPACNSRNNQSARECMVPYISNNRICHKSRDASKAATAEHQNNNKGKSGMPITSGMQATARARGKLRKGTEDFQPRPRVSKQTKINFGSNQNKLKQDLFRVCSVCFVKPKKKNFGLFRFSNLYRNNQNKQNCFITT